MKIFLIQRVSQVRACSDFLTLMLKFKEKMKITKKVIVDGKEINDTENESKYALVEV